MSTSAVSNRDPLSIPLNLYSLPEKPFPHIFSYLHDPSDWNACSLTSKDWQRINEQERPLTQLVNAIKNNQFELLRNILSRGVSVHFRIGGTKLCPNVSYTPLLCAQDYGASPEMIALLKQRDGGFTEQFLKHKLLALCYDVDPRFTINGCAFRGAGLDHFSHHHHLLPYLIDSVRSFFAQFKGLPYWDEKKTERLLSALQLIPCASCSREESLGKIDQAIKNKELAIFSETVDEHGHWVTFAALAPLIAIGNRGRGAGDNSGAQIYRITEEFTSQDIGSLFDVKGNPKLCHASYVHTIHQTKQQTGSCSRYSFEAGLLAGIFLLVQDGQEALNIFKQWWEFDMVNHLDPFIEHANSFGYTNPRRLARLLRDVAGQFPHASPRKKIFSSKQASLLKLAEENEGVAQGLPF